jgi:hypothetical protein
VKARSFDSKTSARKFPAEWAVRRILLSSRFYDTHFSEGQKLKQINAQFEYGSGNEAFPAVEQSGHEWPHHDHWDIVNHT